MYHQKAGQPPGAHNLSGRARSKVPEAMDGAIYVGYAIVRYSVVVKNNGLRLYRAIEASMYDTSEYYWAVVYFIIQRYNKLRVFVW